MSAVFDRRQSPVETTPRPAPQERYPRTITRFRAGKTELLASRVRRRKKGPEIAIIMSVELVRVGVVVPAAKRLDQDVTSPAVLVDALCRHKCCTRETFAILLHALLVISPSAVVVAVVVVVSAAAAVGKCS